jgi:hypothetical protein
MKNQSENAAAPKALSTPTLVLLAIGGALILYMLLQPMFASKDKQAEIPNTEVSGSAVAKRASQAGGETLNTGLTAVAPEKVRSGRDPFLPSSSYIRKVVGANGKPDLSPTSSATKPVVKSQPQPEVAPVVATRTGQFVWRGVVGDFGSQQVVLIQHNARTYILRQGDPVPGTKYTVTEVTSEMVVLASPSGQLRLVKKKEAKING